MLAVVLAPYAHDVARERRERRVRIDVEADRDAPDALFRQLGSVDVG